MDQSTRRYTRACSLESVISSMSGPPPETTQDRTQVKDIHPVLRIEIKIHDPAKLEGRDSIDHATATDTIIFLTGH